MTKPQTASTIFGGDLDLARCFRRPAASGAARSERPRVPGHFCGKGSVCVLRRLLRTRGGCRRYSEVRTDAARSLARSRARARLLPPPCLPCCWPRRARWSRRRRRARRRRATSSRRSRGRPPSRRSSGSPPTRPPPRRPTAMHSTRTAPTCSARRGWPTSRPRSRPRSRASARASTPPASPHRTPPSPCTPACRSRRAAPSRRRASSCTRRRTSRATRRPRTRSCSG